MLACFSRVAEVLLAASHGHISVLCQRAPANSKHCQCVYRELREAHDRTTARWPTAPWMLARASTKRMRCQCGLNTMNTKRCVALFVTLGLRPRKANASAKRVRLHESHDLARCSKWAHLHFSSAYASVQTETHPLFPASEGALGPMYRMCPMCPITRPRPFCPLFIALLRS